METIFAQRIRPSTRKQVALSLMINQLSVSTLPAAIRRQAVIINEIPAGLSVRTDRQELATVIAGVLQTMIQNSRNHSIRISANVFTNLVQLYVKGGRSSRSSIFQNRLAELQKLAQRIGANLHVACDNMTETTIALSLSNQTIAA